MRPIVLTFSLFLGTGWLSAQAPLLTDEAEALRRAEILWAIPPDMGFTTDPQEKSQGLFNLVQAGAFVADSSTPHLRVPLAQGLGLGTALEGGGLMFHIASRWGWIQTEARVLALRDPQGGTSGRLHTGSIALVSPGGWRMALEQTPLKWGYGPLGGHLFGTSSQPFPRASVHTPVVEPRFMGISFGRWQAETFTGRLEAGRNVPEWQSAYAHDLQIVAATGGDVQRPFLTGWRLKAEFSQRVELQLAWTSMWGGMNPNGTNRLQGLGWYDYFLASLGAENIVQAEADGNPDHPTGKIKSLSNAIAIAEVRFRSPELARMLNARGAYFYYGRSGENVNWQWKDFFRNPLKAAGKDLEFGFRHSVKATWKYDRWASAPSLMPPTHALGVQVVWPAWSFGAEYRDTAPGDSNILTYYQVYEHSTFISGHSRYGDSLGIMFGGNLVTRTMTLDWEPASMVSGRVMLTWGTRAFRDDPVAWVARYPGLSTPLSNTFLHGELAVRVRLERGLEAGLNLGILRERHLHFTEENAIGHNLVFSLAHRF